MYDVALSTLAMAARGGALTMAERVAALAEIDEFRASLKREIDAAAIRIANQILQLQQPDAKPFLDGEGLRKQDEADVFLGSNEVEVMDLTRDLRFPTLLLIDRPSLQRHLAGLKTEAESKAADARRQGRA